MSFPVTTMIGIFSQVAADIVFGGNGKNTVLASEKWDKDMKVKNPPEVSDNAEVSSFSILSLSSSALSQVPETILFSRDRFEEIDCIDSFSVVSCSLWSLLLVIEFLFLGSAIESVVIEFSGAS